MIDPKLTETLGGPGVDQCRLAAESNQYTAGRGIDDGQAGPSGVPPFEGRVRLADSEGAVPTEIQGRVVGEGVAQDEVARDAVNRV